VVLYSDGLYEAKGKAAEQYGFEWMADTLGTLAGEFGTGAGRPTDGGGERLMAAVNDYAGGIMAENDQTVVVQQLQPYFQPLCFLNMDFLVYNQK